MADAANELKQLRAELGLTQDAMAKKFDVFLRTYQRWESGESKVREIYLAKARSLVAEAKGKPPAKKRG